uniref:ACT domain-containing protein ACR n=1 Tax=Chenopodium quinoa TaxID=63459 RepID=A0A803N8B2_CHEQI
MAAAANSFLTPTLSLRRTSLFHLAPQISRFDADNNKNSFISSKFLLSGLSLSKAPDVVQASPESTNAISSLMSDMDSDPIPMPVVLIDQDSDPVATIVQLSFGDRLGALIDTMKALKDLGLDVSKGIVTTEGAVKQTKLFITRLDSGRKIEDPDMLEQIRLTIIDNLLKYHPESSERLAMGEAFGVKAPVEKRIPGFLIFYLGRILIYARLSNFEFVLAVKHVYPRGLRPDVDVATHIHIQEDGPKRSLLYIETADRSGLLMEVIKIMSDINVDVESAEIDTEGLVAKDKFHVSYRGAALNSSLSQVLVNCLRYYLRRPQTDEDSY